MGCVSRRLLAYWSKAVVWCLCGAYLVVNTRVVAGGVALRYLFGQSWFVLIGLFILRFLDDFVW